MATSDQTESLEGNSSMDDGSRCLLDVINDPNLLESFLDNNDTNNQVSATSSTDGHAGEQSLSDVNGKSDQSTSESINIDKKSDIVPTIMTSSVEVGFPPGIDPNVIVKTEPLVTISSCPPSTSTPIPTATSMTSTPSATIPTLKPAAKPKPKRTPTKKAAAKKGGQSTAVTSSTMDHAKQVDLVTSSGCVNSPPPFGTLGDGKKGINPLLMSPGLVQGTTIVPGGQLIRNINPGQLQGWPQMVRAPTMAQPGPGGLPQVFQTVINGQQIVLHRTPNGGLTTPTGQQVILGPPPGGGGPGPPPQAGQLVQIVQTPNGPQAQLIQQSPQQYPVIQPSPPPPSKGSKGGNKQILPKPSSGSGPAGGRRNSTGPSPPTVVHPSSLPPGTIQIAGPNGQPQYIQLQGGPNNQGNPSIISGPNGTLLLNPYGGQNFGQNLILQGNNLVGNTGMPLQLQLRTGPNGQMVAVSSSSVPSSSFDSSSVGGFTTVSSMAPMGGVRGQAPTFVMGGQSGQPTMVMGPRGQQLVINRPQMVQQQPQLIQIQTPNGPMVIALQANPQQQSFGQPGQSTLMPQQGQQQFVQSQPMFGGQQLVQGPNGPMLVSTQNFQPPQPMPMSPTIRRSSSGSNSSVGDKSNKSAKGGGVNLADLLKETGILPDSSPPTSPQKEDRTSVSPMTNTPTAMAATPVPSQPQQFQQPSRMFPPGIVIGQSGQPTPQLRLAVTPEGNVFLQPSLPPGSNPSDGVQGINLGQPAVIPSNLSEFQTKILDNLKDSCGPGSSQPSPDSTTPTLDTGLPTGPSTPISGDPNASKVVPKSETSDSLIPVTVETLNTSNDTNTVPVHGSPSVVVGSNGPMDHGTPVIDSSGAVQISLNNHEFLERLDNQIKELSASPSLTLQQKQLLIEFTKLQNTISEAKKQSQQFQAQAAAAAQQQQQSQSSEAQVSNNTQPQLVNLLKPSPSPSGQQIRLTPTSQTNSSSGTMTTYQLGNQIITISSNAAASGQNGPVIPTMTAAIAGPAKAATPTPAGSSSTVIQTTTQTPVPPVPPQLYQVVRLSQQPKSPTKPVITKDSQVEKEKLRLKIQKLFNQQLTADQNAALRPDCRTPFKNRDDACKRLLRYHVFAKPTFSPETLAKIDEQFESVSKDLLIAKELLFDRFRKAKLKSSMNVKSSEIIMLDRLFVEDETTVLKFDKEVVAQGMTLDLPSPPESWKQEITASIDAEVERESRKRKLPFLDEDLSEHLPPEPPSDSERIKRVANNSDDDGTEEEDDEDDDDDSDNDDSDDNQADDIAKYLGPNDGTGDESAGNLSDLNSLYGEPIGAYDGQGTDDRLADFDASDQQTGDLMFDGLASGASQDSWGRGSSFGTDRNNPWPTRFAETEAAAAVDSILTSDDEEDNLQGNGTMSMNGLDEEDDEDEDDDEDVEEDADAAVSAALDSIMGDDEVSGSYQIQEPPELNVSNLVSSSPCDVQMQSAIDSILQSSGSSVPVGYYDNGTGYSGRVGYENSSGLGHHRSSNSIVSNFGHQPGQISDPVLDEAVKSILS